MTPSPPRSVAELTVWAASHPGGAADEIKRLRDALDGARKAIEAERDRWQASRDGASLSSLRDYRHRCGARVEALDFALASFSDRPDERNQT